MSRASQCYSYSSIIPGALLRFRYTMPIKGSRENSVPVEPDEPGEIEDLEIIVWGSNREEIDLYEFVNDSTLDSIYKECEKSIGE